ncbi:hypothetical protein MMC25_001684 [Agyrium rufum]|nr:hypothetical protein [Agyrium rufum]
MVDVATASKIAYMPTGIQAYQLKLQEQSKLDPAVAGANARSRAPSYVNWRAYYGQREQNRNVTKAPDSNTTHQQRVQDSRAPTPGPPNLPRSQPDGPSTLTGTPSCSPPSAQHGHAENGRTQHTAGPLPFYPTYTSILREAVQARQSATVVIEQKGSIARTVN